MDCKEKPISSSMLFLSLSPLPPILDFFFGIEGTSGGKYYPEELC